MFYLLVVGIIIAVLYSARRIAKGRRTRLLLKYQDAGLVDRLIYEDLFPGETAQQLRDSLGEPHDRLVERAHGTTRSVWRYRADRRHQYRREVTLENDRVVEWHQLQGRGPDEDDQPR